MEIVDDARPVLINEEPIELFKLLKVADLLSSGGEAKMVIAEGYVCLNGEIQTQKRKKVFAGDVVEFNGELIQVFLKE